MKKKVIRKHNNARLCFICGTGNNAGLHARYYELDDGSLVGIMSGSAAHQSYPGRMHGGIISAMLDESLGRAINVGEPDTWAVTVELTTRYKHPVPINEPLYVTGRILTNNRKLFTAEGEVILKDGTIAASATGKYMKMPLENIANLEAAGDTWELCLLDDDPSEIDFPER